LWGSTKEKNQTDERRAGERRKNGVALQSEKRKKFSGEKREDREGIGAIRAHGQTSQEREGMEKWKIRGWR